MSLRGFCQSCGQYIGYFHTDFNQFVMAGQINVPRSRPNLLSAGKTAVINY